MSDPTIVGGDTPPVPDILPFVGDPTPEEIAERAAEIRAKLWADGKITRAAAPTACRRLGLDGPARGERAGRLAEKERAAGVVMRQKGRADWAAGEGA